MTTLNTYGEFNDELQRVFDRVDGTLDALRAQIMDAIVKARSSRGIERSEAQLYILVGQTVDARTTSILAKNTELQSLVDDLRDAANVM